MDWLFKPFLRPFLSDDGGEWLDELGDRMKGWINRALRPVQVVVDVVLQAGAAVMQAVAQAPPLTDPAYIFNYLFAYIASVFYELLAPFYYSMPFLESTFRGILTRAGWKVARIYIQAQPTGCSRKHRGL